MTPLPPRNALPSDPMHIKEKGSTQHIAAQ
jgi:hypothetical protein